MGAQARTTALGLDLGPLVLRAVLGVTFLFMGWIKAQGTMDVSGAQAAALANIGVIVVKTAPAGVQPAPAPAAPLPSGGSSGALIPSPPAETTGGALVLAQAGTPGSPAAAATVSAPKFYTAADFPTPVTVARVWGLALSLMDAGGGVDEQGKPRPKVWPGFLTGPLMSKYQAVAVTATELVGGLLLLLGLATRLAAAGVLGVMLGAIWLTQLGPAIMSGTAVYGVLPPYPVFDPRAWMPLLWQVSLAGSALAVLLMGSGALSVDRLWHGLKGGAGARAQR